MKKKILITGATGFVGQHVIASLADKKVSLTLVVRTGNEESISNINCLDKIIATPDLFAEDVQWWANACAGIDTIIHLAWYAEPGKYLQSIKNVDCLVGSLNLVKGAVAAKVRRFVGIGTCFEYDLSLGVLSIDAKLKPQTPYAGAKAALYLALLQWLPEQFVEFAWCRLFYLYGAGEDSRRFVAYLRAKLENGEIAELTSGQQIRDFLDVKDAADMIVKVALGNYQGPINVCSGIPITIRQLAEKIADEYGKRDLLKFGLRKHNVVDPACVVGISNLN